MSSEAINIENKSNSQEDTPPENNPETDINSKKHKLLKNIIPFSKKWRVKMYILNALKIVPPVKILELVNHAKMTLFIRKQNV